MKKSGYRTLLPILGVLALMVGAIPSAASMSLCNDSLAKLVRQESAAAKSKYLGLSAVANNSEFIELAEAKTRSGMLFFHVENAILKQMNDKILQDKELSASLQSLYAKLFISELEKEPLLRPLAIYSDYKSVRLAYTNDTPELRIALAQAYRRSSLRFREEIKGMPGLYTVFRRFGGELVKNPSAWNLPGLGRSADEAALVSRTGRYTPPIEVGVPRVFHFGDPAMEATLQDRWNEQKTYRQRALELADADLGIANRIFVTMENERKVLNPEVIEVLRKLEGTPENIYLNEVRQRMRLRFGKTPSVELVHALRKYLHAAEAFAPSIYERYDQKNLGIGNSREGVLTFDLAGQNVRNLTALLEVLSRHERDMGSPVELTELARDIRDAQRRESKQFERIREGIELALRESGLSGKAYASGDDVVFVPDATPSVSERDLIFDRVHSIGSGRVRMVFVSPRYVDTGEVISEIDRSHSSGAAENLEKKIRWELERTGAKLQNLKSVSFCLEYALESSGKINLTVRTHGNSAAQISVQDIEAAARKFESRLNRIVVVEAK